jgi:glycosyltransferase involved in cell wall biosynthesis
MKLLFLAPQPFFQERGTPIAVRLALEVLAERARQNLPPNEIDLVTYHEGSEVQIPNVTIHRIKPPASIRGIGPGISFKKLLCDVVFLFTVLRLVWRSRGRQYDLVHAVEESVFIAWLLKLVFRIPYLYDMDSSLAIQVTDKWRLLRPLRPVLGAFERVAVKGSIAVVPVCDALAAIADRHGSRETFILRDVSLLNGARHPECNLRREIGADASAEVVLYVGNLEPYQGIDLLLESFRIVAEHHDTSRLAIIGGSPQHIAAYRAQAESMGFGARMHFLGPRPLDMLNSYIVQADILTSPRVKGNNTPMKIYSYLHSGRAILATELFTHTQVLTHEVAELASPEPGPFAEAMLRLLRDPVRRARLGSAGNALAEKNYTFEVFSERLNAMYDRIASGIAGAPDGASVDQRPEQKLAANAPTPDNRP